MKKLLCATLGLLLLAGSAHADLPSRYDLRDVGGQQYVSTRIDDQVGPGPCWAFAALTAVESNIRLRGLWPEAPNALNLSEQFLRANETTGTTWPQRSPGFSRRVNSGGQVPVAVSHMARLHGPLYEDQCPFEYLGDFRDNLGYYGSTITTPGGNSYQNQADPLWPYARAYPATYDSDLEGAYFLEKCFEMSGTEAIKQEILQTGACYVSMHHEFNAYDPNTNTYYDDGTVTGDGLGAHGVNIIGWDDAMDVPGAPAAGAWLIKQSHAVDAQDPLFPEYAGLAPTYFWVSYQTDTSRFTDDGAVTFFEMDSRENIQSVYFHDYTGDIGHSTGYPAETADASVCAQVFQAGSDGDRIGICSFFTRNDDQPFRLGIYDSLDDLQNGTQALAEISGVADLAGYHTVQLAQPVLIDPEDDFVVFLDFTDGADQIMAYTDDGTGNTGAVEQIQPGWCYYYDQQTGQWTDLEGYWDGQAFTVKAYGVVIPEPLGLSILLIGAGALLRRRRTAP